MELAQGSVFSQHVLDASGLALRWQRFPPVSDAYAWALGDGAGRATRQGRLSVMEKYQNSLQST